MTTPATVTLTLPLPPRSLHPNARPTWVTKARDTREYRLVVQSALNGQFSGRVPRPVRRFTRVVMSLSYVLPVRRRRDDDGLIAWFKAGRDQIAAFLGVDDASDVWRMGAVTARVSRTEAPHVQVALREDAE